MKYNFLSMESWMNIKYKYKGIQHIFHFSIAQKRILKKCPHLSKLQVNVGQLLLQLQWRVHMCTPI